jgi:hypothetical protein
MKRFAMLLALAILLASNASSQLRFGLRGGLNTAYFKASEIRNEEESIIATTVRDANFGFHGGVMAQLSFFGMFIMPELLFSSVSNEVRLNDLDRSGVINEIRSQKYTKLDFPVLVGKRLGPLRFGVGPVGTIMLGTDTEMEDLGIREKFNTATFGYQLGTGLDLGRIALDLKYEGNLSRLGSGVTVRGQERPFDSRSSQFIVSLGIFF